MKKKTATQEPYKIEKGIPIDNKYNARPSKFPFAKMKIGDSFLIPKHMDEFKKHMGGVYSHLATYNSKAAHKIRIACRMTSDGLRVWRIQDKKK